MISRTSLVLISSITLCQAALPQPMHRSTSFVVGNEASPAPTGHEEVSVYLKNATNGKSENLILLLCNTKAPVLSWIQNVDYAQIGEKFDNGAISANGVEELQPRKRDYSPCSKAGRRFRFNAPEPKTRNEAHHRGAQSNSIRVTFEF